MALTFTDWEHYTDDEGNAQTLDWSSAGAIAGNLLRPHAEALRQALVERWSFGWPDNWPSRPVLSAILSAPIPNDQPPLSGPWLSAFNAALDTLLPRYCDHTQAMVGAAAINNWSMASALSSLGQSRVTDLVPLASWAAQQYGLLNLLRWRRIHARAIHDKSTYGWETWLQLYRPDGSLYSEYYSDSRYLAAARGGAPNLITPRWSTPNNAGILDELNDDQYNTYVSGFPVRPPAASGDSFQCDIAVFFKTAKEDNSQAYNNPDGLAENQFFQYLTVSGATIWRNWFYRSLGAVSPATGRPGESENWRWRFWDPVNSWAILKIDTGNNLKFK